MFCNCILAFFSGYHEEFDRALKQITLSVSPSKSGPFDFATKKRFTFIFASEKALVHMYQIHKRKFK